MKKIRIMTITLLALLAPIMSAWAGKTSYYYSSLKTEVKSGSGMVYAAASETAEDSRVYDKTSGPVKSQSTTTSGGSVGTFYAYAKPDTGWKFVKWTDASGTAVSESEVWNIGKLNASTTKNGTQAYTYYAYFEELKYTAFSITFQTSDAGSYTVDGAAPVNKTGLEKVTSVVLESLDSNFLSWTINGETESKNPYTASCTSDTTISANFLTADQVTTATTYDELTAALANEQYLKITIPSGKEIVVAKGATLTVPTGRQLVVDGTLWVLGSVANSGMLIGNGAVIKSFTAVNTKETRHLPAHGTSGSHLDANTPATNPWYDIDYDVTEISKTSGTVLNSGSISCRDDKVGLSVDGGTTWVVLDSLPSIVSCSVVKASGINRGRTYLASYSDFDSACAAVHGSDSKILVLLANASINSSDNWQKKCIVDCACNEATISAKQINASVMVTFLNGKKVKISGTSASLTNAGAAFVNCSSIDLGSVNANSDTNRSQIHLYDCTSAPSGMKFPSGGCAWFYSGTYSMSFGTNYKVYGGSYTKDPSLYLASGDLEAPKVGSYYVVREKAVSVNTAKVRDTEYLTLQEAINAASSGEKITLLADVTLDEAVTIGANKTLTIELVGFDIAAANGAFVNNGTLYLEDSSDYDEPSAVSTTSGNLIVNNGTLEITYGKYTGAFQLNSGSTTAVHNGTFIGNITAADGAVVHVMGGVFSASVAQFLTVTHEEILKSGLYNVGEIPHADIEKISITGADAAYQVALVSSEDFSLYTNTSKSRDDYTDTKWRRKAEMSASVDLFGSYVMDVAVAFDRYVSENTVKIYAGVGSGSPSSEMIDSDQDANTYYRVLSPRIVSPNKQIAYSRMFVDMSQYRVVKVGVADTTQDNVGTVASLEHQLCSSKENGTQVDNVEYRTAICRYMLGGKKAAVDRDDVRTAYDSLADAVDAENLQNGDWVLVGADSTEKITIAKAGTFTIDPYGFNYDTANVSIGEAYFAKSTTEGKSRAAAQNVESAKAVTFEVARKVASVGAKFYDKLVDAVDAANGETVTLYAATDETITLGEGQSFTLNKNGVAFDDAKVVTSVAGYSVKAEETQGGTLYTVVQIAVEDANGNSYATIGEAIAQTASDTVEVTVTAPVVQDVEVPQGKTVTVTIPEDVAATVTVEPAAGSFLVTATTTDANNNKTTTYEAKQITEVADEITVTTAANIKVEEVSAAGETNAIETVATIVETVNALMCNKALERADNTAKIDVLKEITVVPSAIVRVVDNNDKAVVKSAAFDVTPKDANGDKVTTDDAFTFRLPIDADIEVGIKTIVRHEGVFFGLAAIQAWSNYKFIEVTSSNFSEYSYEILDGETDNPVAAIGTTGYATLAGAIAGAQSGDTVQLLADITGVTTTYNIDKAITIDGQGLFKIAAGENAAPRPVVSAWGGPRAMFDLTRSTANVTFKDITLDNGEGHYYSYFVRAKSGTATFEDVALLRGAEKDSSGTDGAGYGAAILADGGNIVVKGDFYADTHGEPLEAGEAGDRTSGIFPFTAILHQGGGIYFHDGVNANIGQDLLLVGKQNEDGIDASDEEAKAQIQTMLDAMNVPAGYVPYTLNLADSAQLSFLGASPLGWNSIINYGKDIMTTASDAYGMELDTATTPVEVGLLDDTVLTEPFTYEDSNFTINGNGNTLSGTIAYTDNAGTMENVVMGTEEAPLVLDMTGLGEGKSINLGTGIAAENVTIKVTEEQAATQGQTIVTWNTEGETIEESAAKENGIKVEIVDEAGETIVDEETGEPQEASLVWDAEVGRAYIGPCEARLTTVDANNETAYIYTSLARAIELARNSGDTVTLMMDIENFSGTQEIYKSLVLDGAGHKIAAKPVTTHRNTFSTIFDGTAMLKINGPVTIRNITIDGDASHAYTYLVSADNSNAALTTENVVLLHGGELAGDENGAVLEKGAGYGAAIHLNNGASIIVKDGFYADTHGAPAEPGQTIEKSDGVFPFTGILPEGNSSVEFRLTADTDAAPTVAIGSDLLLVGMVGAIDSETAQGILDYMKVPSRFRPYTLTLGDGSAYAFTGASLLGWNEIIDYGKDIMDVSKQLVDVGLDKETTPVEVGLLTDTELPDTFTYEDANFTVNGNGNALSGTIKYTDEAGIIENIVLGTEEKPLVLDLREVTDPVEIGNLIAVDNVTVLMTAEQATLGQPVFTWNVETASEPDNAEFVKITVLESAEVPYDPEEEAVEKGLVWDDELGIAYIGPCEARLTGPEREPGYMDLTNAFNLAADGDTITIFWAGVALNQQITLGAGTLTLTKGKYDLEIGENGGFLINDLATVLKSDLDLVDCIALGNEDWLLSAKTSDGLNTYRAVARGTYNVAVEDANGVETTAPIMVPDEWVAANAADAKTLEEIEAELETFDSTLNMKRWQAYVMNQTTQFKATSFDHASGAVTIAAGTPKDAATTGFEVSYSLDEVTPVDVTVESGTRQSSPDGLAVAVTSVETHAFFKVRIHFTSTGEGREFAHASMADTIGVLAVDGLPEEAIVAVPWADVATGGALTLDKLVDPSTLASGDEILAYDTATGKFMAWRLAVEGSVKSWQPVTTVAKDGCAEAKEAAAYPVARGGGVWLLRGAESQANKVYLAGSAVQDKATVALAAGTAASPSWTLVGTTATGETAIADFAQSGDRVVVLLAATPRNYTFKNGAWGYSATEPVMKNGVQVGVRPVHKTGEATIKPGCGFWYLNTSGAKELSL